MRGFLPDDAEMLGVAVRLVAKIHECFSHWTS